MNRVLPKKASIHVHFFNKHWGFLAVPGYSRRRTAPGNKIQFLISWNLLCLFQNKRSACRLVASATFSLTAKRWKMPRRFRSGGAPVAHLRPRPDALVVRRRGSRGDSSAQPEGFLLVPSFP